MSTPREHLPTGQIWWVFILRGVFAAVLGVFALIWPTLTLEILVLFVGAYLIADGVMGLVVALRRAAPSGRLLQPALSVVIGLLVVLWPSQSARTLFMVLGAGALFIGISYVIAARQYAVDAMGRRLMTTGGIIAGVLGVILIVWPGAAVVTVSWIIAAAALLMAAVMIFLGVRLRQLRARVVVIPPDGPSS
ncbi:MAG: hypothetical protein GWP69_10405 [Gammaproteobacteria bacterium]|jgi:uncharacterized membrane protein HdeD (DUF308 family)|nr:hypothetical protein [Gammaproteobacteria bacterium]